MKVGLGGDREGARRGTLTHTGAEDDGGVGAGGGGCAKVVCVAVGVESVAGEGGEVELFNLLHHQQTGINFISCISLARDLHDPQAQEEERQRREAKKRGKEERNRCRREKGREGEWNLRLHQHYWPCRPPSQLRMTHPLHCHHSRRWKICSYSYFHHQIHQRRFR